jgi:hypothetical protein
MPMVILMYVIVGSMIMSQFIIEFDENYECPCIKDGTDCGLNMILNCVGYYGNRNPECPLIKIDNNK